MISLTLPYPPTANNLFFNAGKRRVRTKEYDAWIDRATKAINWRDGPTLDGPYSITIQADRPDRRRRDIANCEKAVSDVLVSSGVIADDCLADEITLRWTSREPVKGAAIHITIIPLGAA